MNTLHTAQGPTAMYQAWIHFESIFLQSILSLPTYLEDQLQLILDLLGPCLKPGNNSGVCI